LSAVNFREKAFWRYHKKGLRDLGVPLDATPLLSAISWKIADLILNPKHTVEILFRRLSSSDSKCKG
jgi:hypothetical protein